MTINADGSVTLDYGPVGDPNSRDPWEFAQARMPEGWHVEGQVEKLRSVPVGYRAIATRRRYPCSPISCSCFGRPGCVYPDLVEAIGYTADLALANLIRRVPMVYPEGS